MFDKYQDLLRSYLVISCTITTNIVSSQSELFYGFEVGEIDVKYADIREPFVLIHNDSVQSFKKVDQNPEEYRGCLIAYDTSLSCALIREIKPWVPSCSMIMPYSGRSSIVLNAALNEAPWLGNYGMFVVELEKPLKKNVKYSLEFRMLIASHWHDSLEIAGVGLYTFSNARAIEEATVWDPERARSDYLMALEYPNAYGQYWFGQGIQPTLKWLHMKQEITPVYTVRYLALGLQRQVPDHVYVHNGIEIVLDDLLITVSKR